LRTEEGLACINTLVNQECKSLWRPALHYYSVCRGVSMSFAELYADLSRYISDPDRCWEQCMRVKRGFEDTSQHGAFAKDQVYLDGAIRILAERHELDFELLYTGQVSLDDMVWVAEVANISLTHTPHFLKDVSVYRRCLEEIIEQNGLEPVLAQRVGRRSWEQAELPDFDGDEGTGDLGAVGCDDCGGLVDGEGDGEEDDVGSMTETDDGGGGDRPSE